MLVAVFTMYQQARIFVVKFHQHVRLSPTGMYEVVIVFCVVQNFWLGAAMALIINLMRSITLGALQGWQFENVKFIVM